jgi:hypothetical protein
LLVAIVALLSSIAIVLATKMPVAVRAPVVIVSDLPADDTLVRAGIDEWRVGNLAPHRVLLHRILELPNATDVVVTGWAYYEPRRSGDTIVGVIDETAYVHAEWGIPRPDIAAALGRAALSSGFRIILNTMRLTRGLHTLRIAAVSPASAAVHRGPSVQFVVR